MLKLSLFKAFVFQTICLVLIFSDDSFCQKGWKIALGNNLTEYKFVSSQGTKASYFKLGSGNSAFISSENTFLDTLKFVVGTDKKSVYFQNNRFQARLLSSLHYELGISYNQYNAIGDIQNIGFRYQTNYLGLVGGLGANIPLFKGFTLGLKGKAYAQQLVQGTQELNSRFLDLQEDTDFKKPALFLGGSIELNKRVNNGIILFIQVERYQTFRSVVPNEESLNFLTFNSSFGVKFIP